MNIFFLLILPLSLLRKEIAAAPETRPNILFIITDDQERREFNFLNEGRTEQGQPRNLSPHIDRLAQEGVVFPNQYVTSPVCTPSRFSVLTGTYASRSASFQRNVDRGEQVNITWNCHIDSTTPNLARTLQQSGYYTVLLEKIMSLKPKVYRGMMAQQKTPTHTIPQWLNTTQRNSKNS